MEIVTNKVGSWRQQMYLVAPVLLLVFLGALLFMHRAGVSVQSLLDIVTRVVKEGAPFALMACGGSLVIAAGSIDLSVVGTVAVSGAIFAALTQLGAHPLLAASACMIWGLAVGLLLGFVITKTRCPALIMSWSVGVIGLLSAVLFGGSGAVRGTPSSIPLGFVTAADFWAFPSLGFVSALACVFASALILNWSNFPTFCCAVGADRKAALYAGIDTKKVQLSAFAINGLLCAIAGIFWALLANSAVSSEHVGKELVVIAVAVLGGTSLSGGYLSLWSVIASAFFWSAAKTLVDSLDLGLVGSLQSEAASGIFALVLIGVVLVFSRNLVSYEGSIFYRQKSSEGNDAPAA
jgi:ribose/xylose/arabinose/galactoside ABC-type transport system permease subunit